MTASGMFWHIHHEILLELSHNIQKRIEYIKTHKPDDQIELRLRLIKPVQGELPKEVIEAKKAYDKADLESWIVWKDWISYNIYMKARNVADEAYKALNEVIANNLPAIMELHSKECPDCPWDGKTIFPIKESK